jgi:5'-methylthioadenosine phosphorylase
MLAIIGGSGLSQLATLDHTHRKAVRTPYGEPSAAITLGRIRGREVAFIARHGYGHTVAPHEVNYRANLWALRECGVKEIISVASVGGIAATMTPGVLAIPDQIIDYTWGRAATFFEGTDMPVTHVDFTYPYTETLRQRLLKAAAATGEQVIDGGTYGATQGPRLETRAEIDRMERDGCHIVGMTGMPEAVLARELDLGYATIAVVANAAAGRASSAKGIDLAQIDVVLKQAVARARRVIEEAVVLA